MTTDPWEEEDWWYDKVWEYNLKALSDEVIAKKKAREFTYVTESEYIDGKFSHVIILGRQ